MIYFLWQWNFLKNTGLWFFVLGVSKAHKFNFYTLENLGKASKRSSMCPASRQTYFCSCFLNIKQWAIVDFELPAHNLKVPWGKCAGWGTVNKYLIFLESLQKKPFHFTTSSLNTKLNPTYYPSYQGFQVNGIEPTVLRGQLDMKQNVFYLQRSKQKPVFVAIYTILSISMKGHV